MNFEGRKISNITLNINIFSFTLQLIDAILYLEISPKITSNQEKGNKISSDLERSSTKLVHAKLRKKNKTIWKKKSSSNKTKDSNLSRSPKLRKKVSLNLIILLFMF